MIETANMVWSSILQRYVNRYETGGVTKGVTKRNGSESQVNRSRAETGFGGGSSPPAPARLGRPRIHADNASRQRNYRERRRAFKAENNQNNQNNQQ